MVIGRLGNLGGSVTKRVAVDNKQEIDFVTTRRLNMMGLTASVPPMKLSRATAILVRVSIDLTTLL